VVAFGLMSIIWTLGAGVVTRVADAPYGPDLTSHVLSNFVRDYAVAAALGFTSTIIAAGYAALAAMLTRSILGGILVGLGITIAEQLLFVGMLLIEYLLGIRHFVYLFRLTPGYNLLNVATWVSDHHASVVAVDLPKGTGYTIEDTLLTSVVILAVWVVGLVSLTAYLFRRQDITG